MNFEKYILGIPDFPKEGVLFYDITPLMANPEAYQQVIAELSTKIAQYKPTKIMAAESRGFFFGPAVALNLRLPFIPIRKKGKLPRETIDVSYQLEYGTDTLCVHKQDIAKDDSLVVLDDILATGGTAEAMCKMVELSGAKVACCAFFMELAFLKGRDRLSGRNVVSMLVK